MAPFFQRRDRDEKYYCPPISKRLGNSGIIILYVNLFWLCFAYRFGENLHIFLHFSVCNLHFFFVFMGKSCI